MACPWMDNGTIVQFLVNCTSDVDRTLLVSKMVTNNAAALSQYHLLQCLDVAHGLEYLHSENVVHGDLKGVSRPRPSL